MVLRIFWDIRRETSLFHWKQVSNHQVPDMIWWKSHLVKQTQLNWYKIMLFLHCSRWFKLGVVSHRENDSTLLSEQSLWGVKPHKQGLYIMNIHWDIKEIDIFLMRGKLAKRNDIIPGRSNWSIQMFQCELINCTAKIYDAPKQLVKRRIDKNFIAWIS